MSSPYFSQAQTDAPYTTYWQSITYVWGNGTVQLPVSSANVANAEMIQVNSPSGAKIVVWTAERSGIPPDVPDTTPGQGETLNWFRVTLETPELQADGVSHIYRRRGVYVYYLQQPLSVSSGQLYAGATPVDINSVSSSVLSPSEVNSSLINP